MIFESYSISQLVLCTVKYHSKYHSFATDVISLSEILHSLEMLMNAALLSPCVMSMPIVRTLSALIVVPVKLDLLERGKGALVRE